MFSDVSCASSHTVQYSQVCEHWETHSCRSVEPQNLDLLIILLLVLFCLNNCNSWYFFSLVSLSEDYVSMCNLPVGGQRPYGRDALVASPVHEYEVSPDYSPPPEELPYYDTEDREYLCITELQHRIVLLIHILFTSSQISYYIWDFETQKFTLTILVSREEEEV